MKPENHDLYTYPAEDEVAKGPIIVRDHPVCRFKNTSPKILSTLDTGTKITVYEFDYVSKKYFIGWLVLGVYQYGWVTAYK